MAEAADAVEEPADGPAPKAVAHLRFARGSPHKVFCASACAQQCNLHACPTNSKAGDGHGVR